MNNGFNYWNVFIVLAGSILIGIIVGWFFSRKK